MTEIISAAMCDLVTGSYEGKTHTCHCMRPRHCWYNKSERDSNALLPEVIEQKKKNAKEYEDLNNNE